MGLTVLAAGHRLTDPDLFRAASRRGRRAGSRTLVAHLLLPVEQQVVGMSGGVPDDSGDPVDGVDTGQGAGTHAPAGPPCGGAAVRVGFVVSKAVGNAVVRNRVKRRLRHAVRPAVATLPPGAVLVIRAQAAAGAASYDELGADLSRCLERVAAERQETR
ncbi:ribonuclease P protein component [Nocardioides sp. BYT-33-1]|uniref:ribonuclease P protein component n=1 Tax=Nocardioides sp. BYT-33-1 TaxID=3416952 RepID=UPI003F53B645